jgi:hypothetical protein
MFPKDEVTCSLKVRQNTSPKLSPLHPEDGGIKFLQKKPYQSTIPQKTALWIFTVIAIKHMKVTYFLSSRPQCFTFGETNCERNWFGLRTMRVTATLILSPGLHHQGIYIVLNSHFLSTTSRSGWTRTFGCYVRMNSFIHHWLYNTF